MLEIILIRFLVKQLGKILRDKGRSPLGLQILFVIGWVGGEIGGAIFGATHGYDGGGLYLCALMGATIGAGGVYAIAGLLKPTVPMGADVRNVFD